MLSGLEFEAVFVDYYQVIILVALLDVSLIANSACLRPLSPDVGPYQSRHQFP